MWRGHSCPHPNYFRSRLECDEELLLESPQGLWVTALLILKGLPEPEDSSAANPLKPQNQRIEIAIASV